MPGKARVRTCLLGLRVTGGNAADSNTARHGAHKALRLDCMPRVKLQRLLGMGSDVLRQGRGCGVVKDDGRRDGDAEAGRQGVAELDCTQGIKAGLHIRALEAFKQWGQHAPRTDMQLKPCAHGMWHSSVVRSALATSQCLGATAVRCQVSMLSSLVQLRYQGLGRPA